MLRTNRRSVRRTCTVMTRPEDPGSSRGVSYREAGVDVESAHAALRGLGRWIHRTFEFHSCRPLLPLGYFANVVPVSPDLGIALSTDGVGTKILVAQAMGRFDTIGIDCVAMNVNDVVCVGARPLALLDYIAVAKADPGLIESLARGLCAGAEEAGISIPGGELAQVRELLHEDPGGHAFDLVATCVGTVHPRRVIDGSAVRPGDLVVGFAANGIHSNGLTLARRVLFERAALSVHSRVGELGETVGEALLRPTPIYVRPALAVLEEKVDVHAFVHITGDGFLNLSRVAAPVGFVIDSLQPLPPILELIGSRGDVPEEEMFLTYNMGTGFCVVVAPEDADRVVAVAERHGHRAAVIGYAVDDPDRRVWIPSAGLVGEKQRFVRATGPVPGCPV